MISTDAHVMEPDALWQELTPRLREHLPKVRFATTTRRDRSALAAARPGHRRRGRRNLFPNYGMALFGIDDIETSRSRSKLYNDWMPRILRGRSQAAVRRAAGVRLRHQGRHQGDAARSFNGPEGRDGLAGTGTRACRSRTCTTSRCGPPARRPAHP